MLKVMVGKVLKKRTAPLCGALSYCACFLVSAFLKGAPVGCEMTSSRAIMKLPILQHTHPTYGAGLRGIVYM